MRAVRVLATTCLATFSRKGLSAKLLGEQVWTSDQDPQEERSSEGEVKLTGFHIKDPDSCPLALPCPLRSK